ETKPLEPWVNVAYTRDYFTQSAPPWDYQIDAPITDLATLRKQAPIRVVQGSVVGDSWDALVTAGFLRVDPAAATTFQLKLRMQVTYPADPKKPGAVAGSGKLPLVLLVHGAHEGWTPKSFTDTGTTVTDAGVTRKLFKAGGVDDTKSYTGYGYLQDE